MAFQEWGKHLQGLEKPEESLLDWAIWRLLVTLEKAV